jgi:hypothetical protein
VERVTTGTAERAREKRQEEALGLPLLPHSLSHSVSSHRKNSGIEIKQDYQAYLPPGHPEKWPAVD